MSTPDFFRARLDGMVDPSHPLAVLASRLPWGRIEAALAPKFAREDRPVRGERVDDLFGEREVERGGGVCNAGRPRLPIRLMASGATCDGSSTSWPVSVTATISPLSASTARCSLRYWRGHAGRVCRRATRRRTKPSSRCCR